MMFLVFLYQNHINIIVVYDIPYLYLTTQNGFLEDVTSIHSLVSYVS